MVLQALPLDGQQVDAGPFQAAREAESGEPRHGGDDRLRLGEELVLPCYRSTREVLQRALAVDGALPPALEATPWLD